ncbi:unnamed protein product [Mytilus coruscus]|uniref:Glucose-methanol-choline oxidoreductase C-terminal domain-containing protein n=1 Tax=Mytilus coruscus TaxID=42192 RepID=A0A6J8C5H3_MYTCO|nr:unnamed protein product [Mytilus coruscus]
MLSGIGPRRHLQQMRIVREHLKRVDPNSFVVVMFLLQPRSKGYLRLSSKSPFTYPVIDPRYLSHPQDIEDFVRGIRLMRSLEQTEAWKSIGATLVRQDVPGHCSEEIYDSDNYWRCVGRHFLRSAYHFVGTCRMGLADTMVGYSTNSKRMDRQTDTCHNHYTQELYIHCYNNIDMLTSTSAFITGKLLTSKWSSMVILLFILISPAHSIFQDDGEAIDDGEVIDDKAIRIGLNIGKGIAELLANREFTKTLTQIAQSVGPYLGALGPFDIDEYSSKNKGQTHHQFATGLYRQLADKYYWGHCIVIAYDLIGGDEVDHYVGVSGGHIRFRKNGINIVVASEDKSHSVMDLDRAERYMKTVIVSRRSGSWWTGYKSVRRWAVDIYNTIDERDSSLVCVIKCSTNIAYAFHSLRWKRVSRDPYYILIMWG